LHLFHGNIFFPLKYSLAFSEHNYGIALLFFPLYALGIRPLTVQGLATLLGFTFSGYGAFRLGRTLTGSTGAAWGTGVGLALRPLAPRQLPLLGLDPPTPRGPRPFPPRAEPKARRVARRLVLHERAFRHPLVRPHVDSPRGDGPHPRLPPGRRARSRRAEARRPRSRNRRNRASALSASLPEGGEALWLHANPRRRDGVFRPRERLAERGLVEPHLAGPRRASGARARPLPRPSPASAPARLSRVARGCKGILRSPHSGRPLCRRPLDHPRVPGIARHERALSSRPLRDAVLLSQHPRAGALGDGRLPRTRASGGSRSPRALRGVEPAEAGRVAREARLRPRGRGPPLRGPRCPPRALPRRR